MGKLVRIIVVIVLVWCAWWWAAAHLVERGADTWLADRRAEGWQADADPVKITGFPITLRAHLQSLTLVDPATEVSFATENLRVKVPAYWPGDITLSLDDTPLRLSSPDGTWLLRAPGALAQLKLHPGFALQLEQLTANSGPWQLNVPQGNVISAQDLNAEITQDTQTPERYRFAMKAAAFTPGDLIRATLSLPSDWPLTFDTFLADLSVRFDTALDRSTIEDRRPQPRSISIQAFDLAWGQLSLTAHGALTIDPSGLPEGEIDLQVENWRLLLDLAQNAGVLSTAQRGQAEVILNALANLGNAQQTLKLTVGFRQGGLFLGPIPLGPAPRLILR